MARSAAGVLVSTPYIASHEVRARRLHIVRRLRVRVRLPASPSSALTIFDEPCVVTATRRRMLPSSGRSLLAPSGSSHATPLTQTRSIHPLSIAG